MRCARGVVTVFAAAAICWGCGDDVRLGPDRLAPLESLVAPDTVRTGASLQISVGYWIGACESVRRVDRQVVGSLITIAVMLRPDRLPPGAACPDIVFERDTSIVIPRPPVGAVLIRGIQPSPPPLVRTVYVEAR